jgi:glycerol dehydrogenase
MLKVFNAKGKYVQGRDALMSLSDEIVKIGIKGKAFILVSKHSEKIASQKFTDSLKHANFEWEVERFAGECLEKEIERLSEIVIKVRADFIIAIGGGKVIDTARILASKMNKELIVCPTIASSNSACLSSSIIYSEKGQAEEVRCFEQGPRLILVDLDIIAKSPKRYLISGIGDALATFFEARVNKENYRRNLNGIYSSELGFSIAKLCRDIIQKDGEQAIRSNEQETVTPALERVVEAIFLLSGLAIELCGSSAAHSIHNGLTSLHATFDFYHGEKVAFSLLAQLVMEGRPSREIEQLYDFYRVVGLPVTLEQIGISKTHPEQLQVVGERATRRDESIHNEPFEVTSAMVIDALRVADQIGKKVLERSYLSFDAWSRAA